MNDSDYIAIGAAVISSCAMVATVWQGAIARRHSRLSVRPHLDYELIAKAGEPYRLTVVNHGLGPAIVEQSSILIDKTEFVVSEIVNWSDLASKVSHLPDEIEWSALTVGAPIPAGGRVDIVRWLPKLATVAERRSAFELLHRMGLLVTYRSMYDERFSLFKPSKLPQ